MAQQVDAHMMVHINVNAYTILYSKEEPNM